MCLFVVVVGSINQLVSFLTFQFSRADFLVAEDCRDAPAGLKSLPSAYSAGGREFFCTYKVHLGSNKLCSARFSSLP